MLTASTPPGQGTVVNSRILVVDDDGDLRAAVADALRDAGYEVAEARHGREALDRLRGPEPLPRLVILDLSMPVMDGWALLRAMNADPALASLPVVVASGEPRAAAPVPDSGFLRKPFDIQDLLAIVGRQLQLHARVHGERPWSEGRGCGDAGNVCDCPALQLQAAMHREAAAALRESQFHFQTLADSGQALIWTAGLDRQCDYFNRPWLEFTGRTLEQELGDGWLGGVHPDDLDRCVSTYTRSFDRRVPFSLDYRLRHRSGEYRWIQNDGSPRFDSRGEFIGYIGHCLDITERKELQARLVQADRLSSMGMLAAGVAHEINNPLSFVLANLQSITGDLCRYGKELAQLRAALDERLGEDGRRALPGGDGEVLDPAAFADLEERFRDALQGTRRIRDLVRGLGTFSRVEQEEVAPVDLEKAIESAISIAQNEIKYRAKLEKDLRPTSPVLGSEGRLSQVFLNLLVNAAHAIREGDVENNRISLWTWQEGDRVFAELADTGCGIPAGDLDRIFDPFFTTKPIGKGSGLGLNIVRNILANYRGDITVTSEVGRGTRFLIELPAADGGEDRKAREAAEPGTAEVAGRVLVIDDEPGIRSALRRILRNHEVVEAVSGNHAMELLATDCRFDAILCDVMMPAVCGIEVHRWLQERDPGLAARLVFLTGGAFTPSAREYLERVDNVRLEKPFATVELRRCVGELVAAARASPGGAAAA